MDERLISLNAAIKTAHLPVIDDAGYEVVRVNDILALPSAHPGWIPCSESPMKNNSYLVWMPFAPEGHHITVAEWCGSYWNIKTPITAWMPLPAPYIPEGDDKHEG